MTKALSAELEQGSPDCHQKEILFNEILANVPAENSTTNLFESWTEASDPLQYEFDQLLSLE